MNEIPVQENRERRLVMLGRTGAGMTSTANSILFEKIFEERADTRSKSQLCESAQRTICGRSLTIFDTPGFFNTEKTSQHNEWEIDRCVPMAAPGPHAFLMVISMTNRFPPEAQETIKLIEAKFGGDLYKHLIVVFTGKDILDSEKQDFGEFLRNGTHPMIEEVLRKCSNRCVAFNNKADTEENYNQVTILLDLVDRMIAQNTDSFFSTENFGKLSQRLRRNVASSFSRAREKVGFNLGMVSTLIRVVMFVCLFSTILTLWVLLKPPSPIVFRKDNHNADLLPVYNPNPNCSLPSRTQSTLERCWSNGKHDSKAPHTSHTHTCIFIRVILTALERGFSLPGERDVCILQTLNPLLAISAGPRRAQPIGNYPYVQVLCNAIGRGRCLSGEGNRCVSRWFRFVKPRQVDGNWDRFYKRILCCAVGRGWSLTNEETDDWDISRFRYVSKMSTLGIVGKVFQYLRWPW